MVRNFQYGHVAAERQLVAARARASDRRCDLVGVVRTMPLDGVAAEM